MATKKTTKKTTQKESSTENSTKLFSIYGARMSQSGERVNVSILTGKDEEVEWGCISINLKSKNVKVKVTDYDVVLHIPRVDIKDDEEEEED